MNGLLKNIAIVQSGHPFPSRIKSDETGNVAILQMKDLPNEMRLISAEPARMHADAIKEHYILKTDDIIFRSRGQTNTAIIVKADLGLAVVAAPLFSLRVTSEKILPDYLCWWLNQPTAQNHFERHAKGTSARMISREALAALEVPQLPIEKQMQIVELALLGEREQELLSRLASAEKNKWNGILMKTAMAEHETITSPPKYIRK